MHTLHEFSSRFFVAHVPFKQKYQYIFTISFFKMAVLCSLNSEETTT